MTTTKIFAASFCFYVSALSAATVSRTIPSCYSSPEKYEEFVAKYLDAFILTDTVICKVPDGLLGTTPSISAFFTESKFGTFGLKTTTFLFRDGDLSNTVDDLFDSDTVVSELSLVNTDTVSAM
eukprot:IDg3865t1